MLSSSASRRSKLPALDLPPGSHCFLVLRVPGYDSIFFSKNLPVVALVVEIAQFLHRPHRLDLALARFAFWCSRLGPVERVRFLHWARILGSDGLPCQIKSVQYGRTLPK